MEERLLRGMKLGKYQALDSRDKRSIFVDYINAVKVPIIDYIAIGVQDTIHRTSTSLMSRKEWQETFNKLDLASHDPIRKASFQTKSRLFTFEEVDFIDSAGKEVMRQRKKHEIVNGLIVMDRKLGYNFMLTLGTGYKNFKPYRFYLDNKNAIDHLFVDLKDIISPCTKDYQPKIY